MTWSAAGIRTPHGRQFRLGSPYRLEVSRTRDHRASRTPHPRRRKSSPSGPGHRP
ncbi:hypothetical protein ACFFX0_02915 [Citricoccus parietis]|uniref:Uncharacterized protein n=1 Tax=Citricoccus parietis TaxID=592307 RepID=A0ABV5FU78_9MICC